MGNYITTHRLIAPMIRDEKKDQEEEKQRLRTGTFRVNPTPSEIKRAKARFFANGGKIQKPPRVFDLGPGGRPARPKTGG